MRWDPCWKEFLATLFCTHATVTFSVNFRVFQDLRGAEYLSTGAMKFSAIVLEINFSWLCG